MAVDRELLEAARDIIKFRYWQHVLNELLKEQRFKIPVHLAFGHEAVAAALSRILTPDDSLCTTHRNVLHNLMWEPNLRRLLNHYDLNDDVHPGSMGSMNLTLRDSAVCYASSILGNNLAVATGIAMSRKCAKRTGVSFATTGDGAIEEGIFWEVLLHARSHHLPLVILVENNDYSLASTIADRRCAIDLGKVSDALGVPFFRASGACFQEMDASLRSARNNAQLGQPSCVLVEVKTFCQHAGPTPGWPGDPLKIDISRGMMLEETAEDPLFNIKCLIGEESYSDLEESVLKDAYL